CYGSEGWGFESLQRATVSPGHELAPQQPDRRPQHLAGFWPPANCASSPTPPLSPAAVSLRGRSRRPQVGTKIAGTGDGGAGQARCPVRTGDGGAGQSYCQFGNLRRPCFDIAGPDPRHRRGVRHRLAVILGLAVCAVLAGARSFTAIAEWAADADAETLARLGVIGTVPSESTFRRTLQRLDADAFDDLAGAWAARRTTPGPGGRGGAAGRGTTLA